MSAENLTLEPTEESNEHICADLARLLGYRLDSCQEACGELHGWTLRDELNQPTDKTLWFYPMSNHVEITDDAGIVLSQHKLNIALTKL